MTKLAALGPTSPGMRAVVLRRDRRICRYCGRFATEVDHVEPRAHGGLTTLSNLVAACGPCNRQKGDRTPAEWEADKLRQAAYVAALGQRIRQGQPRPIRRARRIPGSRPSLAEILEAS